MRNRLYLAVFVAILGAFLSWPAANGADNRYTLAAQYDWGGKRGFYVDLESSATGAAVCHLADAKLALGVADGTQWQFAILHEGWRFHTRYVAWVTISPGSSRISLEGGPEAQTNGAFVPDGSAFTAHEVPSWAMDSADYRVSETEADMDLAAGPKSAHHAQTWPVEEGPPTGLELLSGESGKEFSPDWDIPAGASLTLKLTFEFLPPLGDAGATLRKVSPLIDRYGQAIPAKWPGKVVSDNDLTAPEVSESARYAAWGPTLHRDAYGGTTDAGWRIAPSGYFSLIQRGGIWWLITPLGNPCFYLGLDNAPALAGGGTPTTGREYLFADLPPHDGAFAAAWSTNAWGDGADHAYFNFVAANLIRKYGSDWKERGAQSTVERDKMWGFSGLGKWGGDLDVMPAGIPSTPVLEHADVPNLVDHPDIFDPAVQSALRESLRQQIAPHVTDPAIVAWSIGNEYDEIITPDEIKKILVMPSAPPAQKALIDYALANIYRSNYAAMASAWKAGLTQGIGGAPQFPDTDIEVLRQFYESRYFAFLYKTVKSLDPNHLYAGYWPSIGWWVGPQDFELLAPCCDLIGYDRYATRFADKAFQTLIDQAGKPILCGEFSFPPYDGGLRGFGKYGVCASDDAEAGRLYSQWVTDAADEPLCVGVCWFEYRDEPVSGRGPGAGPEAAIGEHFAFGLTDDCDRPKWDLVNAVRTANIAAVYRRLSRPVPLK